MKRGYGLNIRVSIHGNWSITAFYTRKFSNFRVSIPRDASSFHSFSLLKYKNKIKIKFPRFIHRYFRISAFLYKEIEQYPRFIHGNWAITALETRKVFLKGLITQQKHNWWEKYFRLWIRGPGTIDSWKKPDLKNLKLLSL
jgi:hypothetical protein